MHQGRAHVPGALIADVLTRTRVTGRASVPNVVRVRTDWPQRQDFIRLLDRLKERRGIRYDSALAEAAGISHTALSNWRSGKVRPSIDLVTRVAEALDEPPEVLVREAGLMPFPSAEDVMPRPLPAELKQLVDLYWESSEERRKDILARVQFVVEWADATRIIMVDDGSGKIGMGHGRRKTG